MFLVVLSVAENSCSDKGFQGEVVRVQGDLVLFLLQFWGVNNMYLGMGGGESYTRCVRFVSIQGNFHTPFRSVVRRIVRVGA